MIWREQTKDKDGLFLFCFREKVELEKWYNSILMSKQGTVDKLFLLVARKNEKAYVLKLIRYLYKMAHLYLRKDPKIYEKIQRK